LEGRGVIKAVTLTLRLRNLRQKGTYGIINREVWEKDLWWLKNTRFPGGTRRKHRREKGNKKLTRCTLNVSGERRNEESVRVPETADKKRRNYPKRGTSGVYN